MSGVIRIFSGIGLMLLITVAHGQYSSHSPYSKFGLGDISRTGFSHNRALGGISVGLRSKNSINYLNPASYSSQDTISFIFDFGIIGDFTTLKSSDDTENTSNICMDHLAISFPVTRFWKTSIGIAPFSKVGYKMVIEELQIQRFYMLEIKIAVFVLRGLVRADKIIISGDCDRPNAINH